MYLDLYKRIHTGEKLFLVITVHSNFLENAIWKHTKAFILVSDPFHVITVLNPFLILRIWKRTKGFILVKTLFLWSLSIVIFSNMQPTIIRKNPIFRFWVNIRKKCFHIFKKFKKIHKEIRYLWQRESMKLNGTFKYF